MSNSIAAPRRPRQCLTGGREWLASLRCLRVLDRLHVSSGLATKSDHFNFGLLPLLLHFQVLHKRCELVLFSGYRASKSSLPPVRERPVPGSFKRPLNYRFIARLARAQTSSGRQAVVLHKFGVWDF